MFPSLQGTYFLFQMHFKMSPEICFNLDQSKILSSDNVLKTKPHIVSGDRFTCCDRQVL